MNNLIDKIRKIEALIEGAQTQGERNAAILAKERINKRLIDNPNIVEKEYALYTQDNWHKKLLLAICRKYGVQPYRYKRQKHTTVMVKINESLLNQVVWKEYLEYSELLEKLVEDVTDEIIKKIHEEKDEEIINERLQ